MIEQEGQIDVLRDRNDVVLLRDGDGVAMSIGLAKEFYLAMKAFRKSAEGSAAYAASGQHGILGAYVDPMGVHFTRNGRAWFSAPWRAVADIARVMYVLALEIEEDLMWESVVDDGSILCMAGVPVGLTSDPRKKRLIAKETNRVSAGGIYEGVVGTPSLQAFTLEGKPCPN